MKTRVDPDLEKILPLLPLRDAATLTPKRARDELVALAESRKDVPLPELAAVKDITVEGAAGPIAARLYASGKTPAPTIVYFHGGGWVAGDLFTHERQARTLALEADAVVVSVDYRRPPETPFPGAFEDCLAATKWAAANVAALGGDAARIAVAGDSAGGNLAAAVAQACRGNGGPRLAAQLLIYPATDLLGRYGVAAENAKYPSREENADGYFLTGDAMHFFASQYLPQPKDSEDPRASPLRSHTLAGLPRAVICTAEFDPLRDEGEAYADALKRAGVEVAYFREPGMVHGYFGMGAASRAANAARQRATAAFKAMLST
ncbi:MAG: alpha/beta hydrolase fold domain-containing protein [Rhodospirillales bacterium]|nr:alpha/beta hydrolase fold domain-containing protein [Rhodospirillales bacterium]